MYLMFLLKSQCMIDYKQSFSRAVRLQEVLIPDGIKQCIDEGVSSIIVLPYFLNSGRHVVEDIPNILNDCADLYPEINISLAPHLGASSLMMDLLIASAETAKTL